MRDTILFSYMCENENISKKEKMCLHMLSSGVEEGCFCTGNGKVAKDFGRNNQANGEQALGFGSQLLSKHLNVSDGKELMTLPQITSYSVYGKRQPKENRIASRSKRSCNDEYTLPAFIEEVCCPSM